MTDVLFPWKGIVELRELEIAVHSTTQMSSKQK